MTIYLGADHRGFPLKEKLREYLLTSGYSIVDLGAFELNPDDDEVDFARLVCDRITEDDKGILLCGSGHGMELAANRHSHIRAILGFNLAVVVQGRQHLNANVLTIPAEWVDFELTKQMVSEFLTTSFSNKERYIRRLTKVNQTDA